MGHNRSDVSGSIFGVLLLVVRIGVAGAGISVLGRAVFGLMSLLLAVEA